MSTTSLFLVAGITGHVGGAAAENLLKEGHKVRAIVRSLERAASWAARGVELIEGDMNDSKLVSRALESVDGAYLMVFPNMAPERGHPEAKKTVASLKEAVSNSPPKRLVLLSSIGAEKEGKTGNILQTHYLEEGLGSQSFPVAIVRAASFYDNYAYALGQAAATGSVSNFFTPIDKKFDYISTKDIGSVVADLLIEGWSGKKIIELGTPYTTLEVAEALSEVLGKKITASALPRDQWAPTLEHMGIPHGKTWSFEEMCEGFNSGWIAYGEPGADRMLGTTPFLEFFEELHSTL